MKKAAFLDRDGVINQRAAGHGYVAHWREFRFMDGALDLLKALSDKDYRLVVVTNQQGVGKGLVDISALQTIHRNLCAAACQHGAAIDGVFFCPHLATENCACRKPRPGLIHRAIEEFGGALDLSQSWMIGDSPRDIQAGAAVGLNTLLVGEAANGLSIEPTATVSNIKRVAECL